MWQEGRAQFIHHLYSNRSEVEDPRLDFNTGDGNEHEFEDNEDGIEDEEDYEDGIEDEEDYEDGIEDEEDYEDVFEEENNVEMVEPTNPIEREEDLVSLENVDDHVDFYIGDYFKRTSSGSGFPPSPHAPTLSDISGSSFGFSTPPDCTSAEQTFCLTPIKASIYKKKRVISKRKEKVDKKDRRKIPKERLYATYTQPLSTCKNSKGPCHVSKQQLYEAALSAGYNRARNTTRIKPGRYEKLCRQPMPCNSCQTVCYVRKELKRERAPPSSITKSIYAYTWNAEGVAEIPLSHQPYAFAAKEANGDETLSESYFDATLDEQLGFTCNTAEVLQCSWIDDDVDIINSVMQELLERCEENTQHISEENSLEQAVTDENLAIEDFDFFAMEGGGVVLESLEYTVEDVLNKLLDLVESTAANKM